MNKVFPSALGATLVVASLLVTSTGTAGQQWPPYMMCEQSNGSGGYCEGSFVSFRNSPTSTDFAEFYSSFASYSAEPTWYFFASYGGASYSCAPSSAMNPMFTAAAASRGYFFLEWDANANCTFVQFENSSQYTSTW